MGRRASQSIPALKQGGKIYPEDLAGVMGLPYIGDVFYVDPTNGNDTANTGKDADNAYASVGAGYGATTNNNHDVVLLKPGGAGSGTASAEASAITWSNSFTHLIGACAPVGISPRARVTFDTADTSPQFTVSGQANIFSNVQLATWVDANILSLVSGNRNYMSRVHLAGIGDATAGDDAAARSLEVNGEECLFEDCTIGLDTVARSTTNAEIELSGAATRNRFRDCLVLSFADNAGHLFITAPAAADMDRLTMFDRCSFINAINSTATTMTEAINCHASVGGTIFLKDCSLIGATDWENSASGNVMIDGAAPTNNTSGLVVDVA